MKPSLNDVRVDPVLSNVAVDYQNDDYVAEMIAPVVRSAKDSGQYYTYDKSKFREENSRRGPTSKTSTVEFGMSVGNAFQIEEHALKGMVSDKLKEVLPSEFDAEADAVDNIMNKLLVEKEKSLADYMANTSNLGNNTTLSGDDQWDGYGTSDPFTNIETAKRSIHSSTFKEANVLLMGKNVYDDLKHHPDLLDRVKYSARGIMTPELMAEVFEVDRVVIAKAGYNSAREGQSDSLSYIWGKHAWLLYVTPTPGFKQVSFAYHFQQEAPRFVDKWRGSEGTDRKSTFVRVTDEYVRKTISTDCAYLIKNAVS